MKLVFKKFGPRLTDPLTDTAMYVPQSLPAIHKYNAKETLTPAAEIIEQS